MKGQDLINKLERQMRAPDPKTAKTNGGVRSQAPSSQLDEAIIEKCRDAGNATKFEALFDYGDTSAYGGNASDADYGLLGILKYYTQDPDQLDRLMRQSRLARPKWDERRAGRTWLRYSIDNALKDVGQTYEWERWESQKSRPLTSSSSDTPHILSDDDISNEPEIVCFADLGEPNEREYLIEKIGVKGYPIVAFGAGGVAKSFAMLSAGIAMASASGVNEWLGLRVLEHGHVLYLDFELDVEEQHRRVRDLCAGMGVMIPKRLFYLSGVGISPEAAFQKALAFTKKHKAKAVITDSMGLAMQGDMEKGKEVLAFHSRYINPLRRAGATPLIVDHEGKLQTGERHKDKAPFGSAYKAWAARSVLQFAFEEYREKTSELDIRVRQTKTNFGPKIDPIGVRFTFEEKKVSMGLYDLPDEELLEEESRPVEERILTALGLEGATIKQLVELTNTSEGTVRNKLSELSHRGVVESNGRRPATYSLISSSPPNTGGAGDDDIKTATVAGLFANPPDWLASQLKAYCKDPERLFSSLCSAVAAELGKSPLDWEDVQADVLRELAEMEGEG